MKNNYPMDNAAVEKLMAVWETGNKIQIPKKARLCLEIVDQIASLFSAGPFYYYIFNFENVKMEYVSEGTREVLGIEPTAFSLQKGFEIIHPEDLSRLHEKESVAIDFLNKITNEEKLMYKVVYMFRFMHTSGTYRTILHQAKALSITDDGKIQYTLGIHCDVTYLNIPLTHDVSFISNERPSYYAFKSNSNMEIKESHLKEHFTAREKEIIQHMSMGKNFNQIADLLFVSPHTITTHKKNILSKSGCKNTPELIAKCFREGII